MGFLGIGAMEALVILVIALIIFGPGRLPSIMGEAGRTVRDFRRATRELTGDFQDSISEVQGTYRDLENEMRSTATDLRKDAQGMADELNTTVADAAKLDSDSPARSTARRQAPKLDQSDPLAPIPRKAASKSPVRSGVSSGNEKSPNGSVVAGDDLLAAEDGDDLLTLDDG